MSRLGEKVSKLLRRIKRGDREGFRELHNVTYNHLTVVAANYTFDTGDIPDVLNEAYFRVYRYINSYDDGRDGYNWMCRIVQNVAYGYNGRYNVAADVNKISERALFYDLGDDIIENTALLQAIKKLGGEAQELIYLKYWEDLSLSEIAARKGMKKPTVYKRLAAALRSLKKFLQEE